MAIPSDTVWEVRTTGSSTNGGGFSDANKGGSGTDYSQQDSAQLTITDAQCGGTTTVTSTGGGFTAAMQGNVCYMFGGGATTGFYCITGYTSGTQITVDRTPGTVTNGTLRVGGAQTGIQNVATNFVAGNKAWVKAGTFSLSSTLTLPNTSGGSGVGLYGVWEGYVSSRGDGSYPCVVIDQQGGSRIGMTIGSSGYNHYIIKYFDVYNTAAGSGYHLYYAPSGRNVFYRCRARSGGGSGFYISGYYNEIIGCECDGVGTASSSVYGIYPYYYNKIIDTIVRNSNCLGYYFGLSTVYKGCIADACYHGWYMNSGSSYDVHMMNCIANNCTYDGFILDSGNVCKIHWFNCIAANNGRYGFNTGTSSGLTAIYNCIQANNASDNYLNSNTYYLGDYDSLISLSYDPFIDHANDDFRLKPKVTEALGKGSPSRFFIDQSISSWPNCMDIGTFQFDESVHKLIGSS